jgi:hypothetical protein
MIQFVLTVYVSKFLYHVKGRSNWCAACFSIFESVSYLWVSRNTVVVRCPVCELRHSLFHVQDDIFIHCNYLRISQFLNAHNLFDARYFFSRLLPNESPASIHSTLSAGLFLISANCTLLSETFVLQMHPETRYHNICMLPGYSFHSIC